MLGRGDVEVGYQPKSISYNYFESTPRKRLESVRLNTHKANVFN